MGEALRRSVPLALTYGLTEACSQVATALPAAVALKPASVGKALPGTSLRIAMVGADHPGGTAAPGEVGEILVQGPTVMRGYLGEAPLDGWLHTGDLGYLDLDGDLYVVQRRTDLIVSGGENVYPAEVENALRSHPDVEDACVVGLPDDIWGQRVAALVVQRRPGGPDAAKLVEYLRGRLAGYKIPRTIAFTDELPCTASGKICRPDVLEILQSEVDAAEFNREGTRYG